MVVGRATSGLRKIQKQGRFLGRKSGSFVYIDHCFLVWSTGRWGHFRGSFLHFQWLGWVGLSGVHDAGHVPLSKGYYGGVLAGVQPREYGVQVFIYNATG